MRTVTLRVGATPPSEKNPGAVREERRQAAYCQCASSLCRGDDRCAKCGKLLRPLHTEKAGAK